MADPAAARSRLLMRLRAAALGAGAAVAWSVLAAGPAAAHEVSDRTGGSSSDPRPVAVGLALVAVAALSGPLFTGAGRVGRVRAAVARLATAGSLVVLAAVPLRPAAAVAAVAAAAVVLAFPGRRLSEIPAAVVLATVAGGGAGGSSAVDRLADCLHVVAAGGWIGAVVEVAVAWRRDPSSGRRAARRVAAPAAGLLAVVVATGSVAAAEHLGDARNALGTGWGRALVAKVSLVALAAAGGAWLRRAWVPRVEASVLAVVAMGGLVLAAVGGPVSGELLPGPLFVARQGASVAVVPLAPGRNTVVVRAGDLRAVTVEVDGRPVALRAGAGGFGTAAVELRAGRHRVRALGKTTKVTVARSHAPTVLRASLPAAGNDADCLDRLAGATAGAAALTRAGHPVRVEVSIGDGPCRVSGQPVPAWDAVDVLLDALAHRRGAAGPPVLVTGGDRRGARLANALSARRPGTTTSAAGTIGAGGGGPIVIATSRDQARAAVAAALRSTGGEAPVVLAPWLLDATLLADLADDRAPVLVAATRDPTSVAALDYRRSTSSLPGGIPPTAAGFEGYLAVLASAAGTSVAPPAPGMFSMSRVGILPASFDVGHGTPAGWSPGVALVRVL